MNSENWKKIKKILEEAVEMPSSARSSFLDKACAGDPSLRREVEELLVFEVSNETDLLERNPVADLLQDDLESTASNNDPARIPLGKQIGKYKITDELGEGGMGAVFLAERSDGAFEQKVALKLIKRGMDSGAILRRFYNERQILASLKHPNIAHLVDGGTTPDGLPYFVMEHVEGETIREWAAREDLDLEERLKIFRQICAAVSFAHQNLVIHRDLKPSNILVTKDGNVKLLDFGIAKLLKSETSGDTAVTQTHAFTPEYASPEQVRGEKLTTASDIYSLGVILYELLTGSRPYQTDSRNIGEIIRVICETEPTRPSSVVSGQWSVVRNKTGQNNNQRATNNSSQIQNPKSKIQNPKSLRGDLDNIILKALRKEPERRYATVEQFSEDIRRHLEGLPVSASRDTWKYRASKFVQRNRLAAAAAVLILLTLVAGLGTTLYQANIARQERAKAERRFNDVRQLANSFMFEFHDAIQSLPGSTPARKLVVSRAIEYLDKLAAEAGGDAALRRELATAYEKIGRVQGNSYYSNLGDTDGAMKSYQRSLEIRRQLAEADPANRELQNELAESHEGAGDMLYTVSDLKGGLEAYENALAIREQLIAAEPNNLKYLNSLATILAKCGDIKGMEGFPNLGDTPGALESYRRAVAINEELIKIEPDNTGYKSEYATRLTYLGMLQTATGDAKNAILTGQKSASILEQLIAAEPNNSEYQVHLMSTLTSLRYPLLDEGRTTEAIENARRVIRTLEETVAADPKNAQVRRSLSVSYNALGKCLLQAKDARGAIESHRRSLAIVEELAAADRKSSQYNRDISLTREFLAEAQFGAGDYDTALSNLRQSIAGVETQLAADDSDSQLKDDLAFSLVIIGRILAAKGDLNGAAESCRRAIPLAEEALQKAPLNVRVKSRHALSFFEAGKVFAKLAKQESGEKREAAQRESCSYLQRGFDIWNEMRRMGTLSAISANRPDEAAKELAVCR